MIASNRYMNDNEIFRNWKDAKDKQAQITILADLNGISRKEVSKIIHKLQEDEKAREKQYKKLREEKEEEEVLKELNDSLITDSSKSVYNSICARLDELDVLIKGYTKEYRRLSEMIMKYKV